ncbi:hypothetical protein CC79DRAFT_1363920 [Sarocladium strictum]
MAQHQFDPVLQRHARRYSLMIAEQQPTDDVSQSLVAKVQCDVADEQQRHKEAVAWKTWLTVQQPVKDQHEQRMMLKKRRIASEWKQFNTELGLGQIAPDSTTPPTIDSFMSAVNEAKATWEQKQESGFGKATTALQNFLNTANNYSYLFKIVPENDKYTSLITGVVTSVVTVCVNHRKNAEQLSDALESISDGLCTVLESIEISDSGRMKALVVDLYGAVFDVLSTAMIWYRKKSTRVKSMLNINTGTEISIKVDLVKNVLKEIRREAKRATESRIKAINEQVKENNDRTKVLERMLKDIQDQIPVAAQATRDRGSDQQKPLESLGDRFQFILLGNSTHSLALAAGEGEIWRWNGPAGLIKIASESSTFSDSQVAEVEDILDGTSTADDSDVPRSYMGDEVQQSLAQYLEVYQDGRLEVLRDSDLSNRSALPSEVTEKVSSWIAGTSSSFLWVEGPMSVAEEQRLSTIAVQLCSAALDSADPLPCVFYTPKPRYTFKDEDGLAQEQVCIAMLYCIASQLSQLLPRIFESDTVYFEASELDQLDGSLDSASYVLDLIEVMLIHSPPTLLVIIDKLQEAECSSTIPHLDRLLKLFRAHSRRQLTKVLFFTGGRSEVLNDELDFQIERADARRMSQKTPGQPRIGWSDLETLKVALPDQSP